MRRLDDELLLLQLLLLLELVSILLVMARAGRTGADGTMPRLEHGSGTEDKPAEQRQLIDMLDCDENKSSSALIQRHHNNKRFRALGPRSRYV